MEIQQVAKQTMKPDEVTYALLWYGALLYLPLVDWFLVLQLHTDFEHFHRRSDHDLTESS